MCRDKLQTVSQQIFVTLSLMQQSIAFISPNIMKLGYSFNTKYAFDITSKQHQLVLCQEDADARIGPDIIKGACQAV